MLSEHRKITGCAALLVLAVLLLIGLPVFSADTEDEPFPDRQRPPSNFYADQHDQHMESQECKACHHRYEDGENVLEESDLEEGSPGILCASCHNDSSKSKIDLQKAFHRQCMGCHDRLSKKGEKTGPSLCGECHSRHKKDNEEEEEE